MSESDRRELEVVRLRRLMEEGQEEEVEIVIEMMEEEEEAETEDLEMMIDAVVVGIVVDQGMEERMTVRELIRCKLVFRIEGGVDEARIDS